MDRGSGTILYTGGFELPDKNAAALRVLGNAKALQALGYRVVLLGVCKDRPEGEDVPEGRNRSGGKNLPAARQVMDGFDAWCVRYPGSIRQWFSHIQDIEGLKQVVQATGNVRAIVCYNYPAVALLKAQRFCRENRIGLFSDCTEWYALADVRLSFKLIKGLDTFMRMRVMHKRLDGLIVISSYLERYYGKCRNVIVVPPLIDRSELKWQGEVTPGDDRRIRLICSGGTLGGKNKDTVNFLLEALGRFPKGIYSLQVVGMTREDYLRDFPAHAQLLQDLGDTVAFKGKVSHKDSIEQVRQADFSILLRERSRKNDAGFPTKFVESLACGVPVIATDTSDIGKYLTDGANGFWTRNTTEGLLETLDRVARLDRAQLGQMRNACRDMVSFDYHQYISRFSGLMAQIDRVEREY